MLMFIQLFPVFLYSTGLYLFIFLVYTYQNIHIHRHKHVILPSHPLPPTDVSNLILYFSPLLFLLFIHTNERFLNALFTFVYFKVYINAI